jgi:predicted nucleotidyltransferase
MWFGRPFGGVVPGVRGAVLSVLMRTALPLTGRQIHGLVSDDHSLWTVQRELKALARLGMVDIQTVGRADLHTVNEEHCAVAPLRALLDPIAALTETIRIAAGGEVDAVILFGSIARGDAHADSDIDLAVIAPPGWDGRTALEEAVQRRLGNACDVLAFGRTEFKRLAKAGEPVVSDLLSDGIALIGSLPRVDRGAA